jgi:hypothetical protein
LRRMIEARNIPPVTRQRSKTIDKLRYRREAA